MIKGTFRCPICMHNTPHAHEKHRWIGVDFDGTLAVSIPNRTDPYQLGKPVYEMVNRVKDWLYKGYTVKLFTARMCEYSTTTGQKRDLKLMETLLKEWCKRHIGHELECVNAKDGNMEVLWDDRAVRVLPDLGLPDIEF